MVIPEGCEVVLDRHQLDTWYVLLINGAMVVGVVVVHVASVVVVDVGLVVVGMVVVGVVIVWAFCVIVVIIEVKVAG